MKDLAQANSFINMVLDILHHLTVGRKIYAIKTYKNWAEKQDEYFSGLKECKEYVELLTVRLQEVGALKKYTMESKTDLEQYGETLWTNKLSTSDVVDMAKAIIKSPQFMMQKEITIRRDELLELRNMIDKLLKK